ncbi:hypothetical protein KC332_g10476 [Hortaea werneckii]|nr:hypothetical protein KC350_g15215 [Hortaea werneckii]KAI6812987.1 hypothetical protein KC358_g11624 [Hortaea werneckii]KAI6919655.1 hypothetical protein KC348_g10579 [Hortaea werneckii]KAI6930441.1 hypothetical protein KC341_g10237 [Hortaea werneckii]KAI6955913.1 hypothetical protein KC321_g15476 [Hortaea werneckii]
MARNSKQSPKTTKAIHQPALQKALRDFLGALGYNLDDIISPASKASSGPETSSSRSSAASSGRGSSTPKSSRSGNSSKSGSPPKSLVKISKSGGTSKSGSSPKSPVKERDGVIKGRIVKNWPLKAPRPASKGLSNLGKGNFCYRNSLFQALLHLPALAHYIKNIHDFAILDEEDEAPCAADPKKCVTCAIQNLWISYWWSADFSPHKSGANCLEERVKHINSALQYSVPKRHDLYNEFKLERMSDPHDLLAWILGQLKRHELEVQPQNVDTPTGNELFGLWMDSLWECEDCGDENVTKFIEPQKGLEISLDNPQSSPRRGARSPSLVQYLRKEFSEDLEIRCEGGCHTRKTDKPKPRERRRIITQAPAILKIMFKRFAQDKRDDTDASTAGNKGPAFKKNRIEVKYEEYLNLGEFTDSDEPLIYRLDSVVAHSGAGTDAGHYIAGVREYGGKTFCCIDDDLRISQQKGGTIEELQTPSVPHRGHSKFDPYLLFYTRIT